MLKEFTGQAYGEYEMPSPVDKIIALTLEFEADIIGHAATNWYTENPNDRTAEDIACAHIKQEAISTRQAADFLYDHRIENWASYHPAGLDTDGTYHQPRLITNLSGPINTTQFIEPFFLSDFKFDEA